jgi:dihydrofolate reductase
MRKLVYYVAATVDGFIAAPDGTWDFFPYEPDMADWIVAHYPETLPTAVRQAVGIDDVAPRAFDTVVMGRGTYQPALDQGIASPYAHLTQYVVAHGLRADGVHVVDGDPVALVRELKAAGGKDIWLAGGGTLAATLRDEIDEYVIKLSPVLAGSGIPVLAAGFDARRLTLTGTESLPSGVVILRYAVTPGTSGTSGS